MASIHQDTTVGEGTPAAADHPSRIAGYEILGLIGEGGMGRVYRARETHPPREVALKLLRGLNASTLARFRNEVELLAPLEHPGIARLYAAGDADFAGVRLPWLALEYVRGSELDQHVAARGLDLQARLQLLIAICRAVHYAHGRGVIHRDLKPANILVDSAGQPKILDFGIARLRADAGEGVTQIGQVLGTVPYMSPEQLAGLARHVDVRSDVYALGVIAYELVCGRLPHPRLREVGLFEALDIVRDEEPLSLTRAAPGVGRDLDAVVMKALAIEPERRYSSAAEFAADIQRILDFRPVEARAPTLPYTVSRFVRRHRALAAAVGGSALILIVASLVSLRYAWSEAQARRDAEARAQEVTAVNGFLERMLTSADPDHAQGRDLRVREILDVASADIDTAQLPDSAAARARQLLGVTYIGLGDAARARAEFDKALSKAGNEVAPDLRDELAIGQASAEVTQGQYAEAEASLSALAARSRLRPDLRITLAERQAELLREQGKQKEAIAAFRALLPQSEQVLGANALRTLGLRLQLASALQLDGDYAGALEVSKAALAQHQAVFGDKHPQTLYAWNQLGIVENKLGHASEAEAAFRRAYDGRVAVLGDNHPATVMSQLNLGSFLIEHGRTADGVALAQHASDWLVTNRPPGDAKAIVAQSVLAYGLEDQGDLEGAEKLLRRVLDAQQRKGGPGAPDTYAPRNNLAMLLMKRERYADALEEFDTLLSQVTARLGVDHPFAAIFSSNRGECLTKLGRLDEARHTLEDSHTRLLAKFGAAHERTRTAAARLSAVYERQGDAKAVAALRAQGPST
jgi:tetratricopeptide (TPR) repeat protein